MTTSENECRDTFEKRAKELLFAIVTDENGGYVSFPSQIAWVFWQAAWNARAGQDANPCKWEQDQDGSWDTSCGEKHQFFDGTPQENSHKFCPYCGHTIAAMSK
jgi:hypothetical protein